MSSLRLEYVLIGSASMSEWTELAQRMVGARNVERNDAGITLRLRRGTVVVQPADVDAIRTIGWVVETSADVDAISERLNVWTRTTTEATDARTCSRSPAHLIFVDPFGYRHEVAVRGVGVDRSKADVAHAELGHVALAVTHLELATNFYCAVLGLRLTDEIDAERPDGLLQLRFLRCNERHHSLAIFQSDTSALNHVELESDDLIDVCRTYDVMHSNGLATSEIGQHSNDGTVSFYLRTPSDFKIEYGFGSRVIDDATWKVRKLYETSIWGHHKLSPTP